MSAPSVLVTGGAGYIGSHAVLALQESGYRPVVLDDLRTGVRAAVPAGVAFYQANVADSVAVRAAIDKERPEAIMHFAGSIVVPESVADPGAYYANNTAASLSLIRTAVAAGIGQFVFSSTAAVYGEPEEQPVREVSRTAPISPYGWSKLMTEQILADMARAHAGFRPVALRYFNVAGADPNGRAGQRGAGSTHLIRSAIEVALGRKPRLEVYGTDYPTEDGTCVRDFVHVSDLASAHVSVLKYLAGGGPPETLNCGYGRGTSVLQVIHALEAITGAPLPTRAAARRPGDAPSVVADTSKIRARLDWAPRFDTLEQLLTSALAWERVIRTEGA